MKPLTSLVLVFFATATAGNLALADKVLLQGDYFSRQQQDDHDLLFRMLDGADRIKHLDPWRMVRKQDGDDDAVLEFHLTPRHRRFFTDLAERSPAAARMVRQDPGIDLSRLAAAITPMLNVSEVCLAQSEAYILYLFDQDQYGDEEWPLKMLDSTGKTPDGILGDVSYFCDVMDTFVQTDYCSTQVADPEAAEDIIFPRGNTKALGTFQGCLKVESTKNENDTTEWDPFIGQYCLVDLLPAAGDSSTPVSTFSRTFSYHYRPDQHFAYLPDLLPDLGSLSDLYISLAAAEFAVCVPSGCTAEDVEANYAVLYADVGAVGVPRSCQTVEDQEDIFEFDGATITATVVYSILGFLLLLGTLVDVYFQFFPRGGSDLAVYGDDDDPAWVSALKCFSADSNGRRLLNTDPNPDGLGCLNGIRVLSMLWVILGHVYAVGSMNLLVNPMKVEDVYLGNGGAGYELLLNAIYSVDSFFFLSGLLVAYFSFKRLNNGTFNIFFFYLHRYIRLTVPLALYILFSVGFSSYFARGPLSALTEDIGAKCRDSWWENLLYVNIYVDPREMCLNVTWYLACDAQMFLLSPLVFYPMYRWGGKAKKYAGLAWWALLAAAFTAVPAALSAKHELPPNNVPYTPVDDYDLEYDFYYMPWNHMQPYLMGILTGYALWKTKGKEVKIHWAISVALWLVAVTLTSVVVFCTYPARRDSTLVENAYSNAAAAAYNGLSRLVWGLSLSWVVFACARGMGGVVDSLLSWGAFAPLARINYLTYLVHIGFIQAFFYGLTYTIELTDIMASYYFVAMAMISYGIGFVATLLIESPFIRLEKMVLGKFYKSAEPEAEDEAKKGKASEMAMYSSKVDMKRLSVVEAVAAEAKRESKIDAEFGVKAENDSGVQGGSSEEDQYEVSNRVSHQQSITRREVGGVEEVVTAFNREDASSSSSSSSSSDEDEEIRHSDRPIISAFGEEDAAAVTKADVHSSSSSSSATSNVDANESKTAM